MYVHQTGNVIDKGLTKRDRLRHKTTSISAATTDDELKAIGWLPVVYANENYNPATQTRTGPTGASIGDAVSPGASSVTASYIVSDKPLDDVKEAKYIEADEEYIRRLLLVGGTKIRGSSAKDTALNVVIATVSKGGPNKQAYENLADKLNALKDLIEGKTTNAQVAAMNAAADGHWT